MGVPWTFFSRGSIFFSRAYPVSSIYHLVPMVTTRLWWSTSNNDPGISSWAKSFPEEKTGKTTPAVSMGSFPVEAPALGDPIGSVPGLPETGCALGGTSVFCSLDQIYDKIDKAREEKPYKAVIWIELKWLKWWRWLPWTLLLLRIYFSFRSSWRIPST